MTQTLPDWAADYGDALREYLGSRDEAALMRAYELGRKAVDEGASILGMATIHHDALKRILSQMTNREESVRTVQTAADFFAELLAPFEMTLRGFQEANESLRALNATLEQRVAERTAELEARNEQVRLISQQMCQTAKLATMGELACSVAHELNNPLATISLRVEAVGSQLAADDPNQQALEIIEQEVERMGALVSNLLQFSRRSQPQISTVDVRGEIMNTMELVGHYLRNPRIVVRYELDKDVPMIHADRQQLRQVFLNLFTNAADAMPQGGTLSIRVRVRDADTHGDAPAQGINIEISDTGVGIPEEILPKVLEPFFTTKPEGKGTGLGLSICRRIVQDHNGALEILSTVGVGTTVRILLPTASETQNGLLA